MAMQNLRPASKKYTIYGAAGTSSASNQISTSEGIIVRGALITGGSGGTTARIRDSRNGAVQSGSAPTDILIGANAGETNAIPIQFLVTQGLYFVLEQGGNTNGEATIFYD